MIRISCKGLRIVECGLSRCVSCEDNTKRCGVVGPVNLHIVCVSLGLDKVFPIALMGGKVMALASYNCLIIVFTSLRDYEWIAVVFMCLAPRLAH